MIREICIEGEPNKQAKESAKGKETTGKRRLDTKRTESHLRFLLSFVRHDVPSSTLTVLPRQLQLSSQVALRLVQIVPRYRFPLRTSRTVRTRSSVPRPSRTRRRLPSRLPIAVRVGSSSIVAVPTERGHRRTSYRAVDGEALLVAERVRLCDIEPNPPPPSPRELMEPVPKRFREMASRPSIGRRVWAEVGVVGQDLESVRGW